MTNAWENFPKNIVLGIKKREGLYYVEVYSQLDPENAGSVCHTKLIGGYAIETLAPAQRKGLEEITTSLNDFLKGKD